MGEPILELSVRRNEVLGDLAREQYASRRGGPRKDGAWLGTALVAELPRNDTVTLTAPSRLLVVGHREFHALMDEMPQLRLQVLDGLARRLRDLEPGATD